MVLSKNWHFASAEMDMTKILFKNKKKNPVAEPPTTEVPEVHIILECRVFEYLIFSGALSWNQKV